MRKFVLAVSAAALFVSGCATRGAGYVPVIDQKVGNTADLQANIAECQQFARQRADAATGAVVVGIAGALIGAMLMPRGFRNEGAKWGAVAGAAQGGSTANDTQENIIRRCLTNRGFNVLE